MPISHNAIHHRFEPAIARKMDHQKILRPYFHTHKHHEHIVLFTDDTTNKNLIPHQQVCLAPLQIEQLYNHYQNTSHPQTWISYGYEDLRKSKKLSVTGEYLQILYPNHHLKPTQDPQPYLVQIGSHFKYIVPQKNKQQFFHCWSFAMKNIHPGSFQLLSIEFPHSDALQNFKDILQWAKHLGWKDHEDIIITTPEPFLYKLHENIQIPDLNFGWAPSTTFLNWIETSGLFIDWTQETSVKGYLCHTLKS
ncbi:MAG: hypothetical protein AB8C84_04070 [Oligoflexales bacterium]